MDPAELRATLGAIGPEGMERFVRESNAIERILREPTVAELAAHEQFLSLDRVRVHDLSHFVAVVARGARLRDRLGMDVSVRRLDGTYWRPARGGPEVYGQLRLLLDRVEAGSLTPYEAHHEYETLHPYEDGNGRSGRALWAWQMRRDGGDPFGLSFLHRWYYQSLSADRD